MRHWSGVVYSHFFAQSIVIGLRAFQLVLMSLSLLPL
jgi:hypothetical protein